MTTVLKFVVVYPTQVKGDNPYRVHNRIYDSYEEAAREVERTPGAKVGKLMWNE